jgi:hypothetical protein
MYVKTSKYHFKGLRDNSNQNLILLKLKLVCQPNTAINLSTLRLSCPKWVLIRIENRI